MPNLKDIIVGFCAACSDEGSVFRKSFEHAHDGVVNSSVAAPAYSNPEASLAPKP